TEVIARALSSPAIIVPVIVNLPAASTIDPVSASPAPSSQATLFASSAVPSRPRVNRFHVLIAVRESTAAGPPSPFSIGEMRSTAPSPRYFIVESEDVILKGTITILSRFIEGALLRRLAYAPAMRSAAPTASPPARKKSLLVRGDDAFDTGVDSTSTTPDAGVTGATKFAASTHSGSGSVFETFSPFLFAIGVAGRSSFPARSAAAYATI